MTDDVRRPDAFERLTLPAQTEPPRPVFVDDLRARLVREAFPAVRLDTGRASAASPATGATAAGSPDRSTPMTQTITPYLCVHDAAAALEWYREYFAATVSNVIPWEGRIGHAEVEFGGAVFYLSDEAPALGVLSPQSLGGAAASTVVLVADVDGFVERVVRGGAELRAPVEEAHGTRNAWFRDPFGHQWNVGTPVVDRQQAASRRTPSEPYYMTLSTADVERGAAFYGAVLGWEFAEPRNGGRHVANTRFPIGLRPTENQFSATEPGQIDMWFTVRDFDDALDRVRAAGGTVVAVNSYDSGREAQCEDDQGVAFKLSEPAPGYDTEA